jgi:uncharacterized protein (TIGR02266 family)
MARPIEREYPRAPYTEPVKFFEWSTAREARATEIGGGGVFLRTAEPSAEGTILTLRLKLPGETGAFTVLGKVVRAVRPASGSLRDGGMGVVFLDIQASHRDRILAYVAERGSLRRKVA